MSDDQASHPGVDPLELGYESVGGIEMMVFKRRPPHLRAVYDSIVSPDASWEFLVYGDERVTAGEFCRMADSVAAELTSHWGVAKGDRVAILSANNPEWCVAFWGTVNAGGIVSGLNGWWKTEEILYGIHDSQAKVLIADVPRFDRVAERLGELGDVTAIFLIDASDDDLSRFEDERIHRFEDLLVSPDAGHPIEPELHEDDPSMIIYTSGTTGRPKGAISTHRSMIDFYMNTTYSAVSQGGKWGASGRDDEASDTPANTQLLTTPLFHAGGCFGTLLVALATGTRVVILKGRFDPVEVMRLIERERVTAWATVPTMVWWVVDHEDRAKFDLSSLHTVAYGGAPSGEDLQRRTWEAFPGLKTLSHVFGLTESGAVGTGISGKELHERPLSVGRPVPTVRIRIVDEDGHDLPPGAPGEILLQGPGQTRGYWGRPEATKELLRDGWLHSGDVGYLDEDGYLYVTDRAKDMIIRGGENIFSVEIENRIAEHPGVHETAVIGVPHRRLGEEVKAVVRLRQGVELSGEDIRDWVAESLSNFKVPSYVEFTDDPLPRSPTGKVLKNVLRGQGEMSFRELL